MIKIIIIIIIIIVLVQRQCLRFCTIDLPLGLLRKTLVSCRIGVAPPPIIAKNGFENETRKTCNVTLLITYKVHTVHESMASLRSF
jgi:hypothetical protein